MEELIKKISQKSIDELEKSKKAPYPLYYKEVFDLLAKEEGILEELNPKLLCLEPNFNEKLIEKTKNIVENMQKTSSSIRSSSKEVIEEINAATTGEIKGTLIKFSSFLINSLDEMENKIKILEGELDEAYKELLIDPLTKAYNRKALDEKLNKILKKGQNKKLDLCVAIVDMDDFKQINDTYGHLVGDFVLIKLVQIIKKLIRTSDNVFRYGGDEFVIVFNRAHINLAVKSIERILDKIRKTKLKYKNDIITTSVSIGVTEHHIKDTIETIIKRADEALYRAKKEKNLYKVVL